MRSSKKILRLVLTKSFIALAIGFILISPLSAGAAPDPNQIGQQTVYNLNGTVANQTTPAPAADDFGCGVSTVFSNCIAAMMYYIGPGLASNIAYIGAYFFSIVIQLSLNSTAYALSFLSEGWQVVRDLANMAFIFILIYIALTVMLQAETAGTIKTLAVVIVIALLVNFSFFFTRVVIDMGNILALQFYNAIPTGTVVGADGVTSAATINGTKDLSASIMGAVQIQSLYGSKAFDQAKNSCGGNSNGVWCGLIVSSVVYLSTAAMLWMLFFAFLQVGIKFMLRIVALWFLLIASPLAFVAKTMKKAEGYFSQWWKMLFQFSLYPAIFLFMFLILTKFAGAVLGGGSSGSSLSANSLGAAVAGASNNGGLLSAGFNATLNNASSGSIMAAIAAVGIRMGFVLALMYVALRVADWVVKEGSSIASSATGWSVGKTLGAAAVGGRYTMGWGAQRFSESVTGKNLAAKGGVLGRTLWRGTSALGKSSFDGRGSTLVKAGAKKLGGVDIGKASTSGGYLAKRDARIAWREKEAKALKPNETQIYKAVGGVMAGMDDADKKKLANAASHYAKTKEAQKNGEASSNDVKEAKKHYNEVLKTLGVAEKIKEAKKAIGGDNNKAYADAITTKSWRNLWGAASGTPAFIGAADFEAARRIRGNGNDAEQMGNLLKKLGVSADDDYDPTNPGGGGNPRGGGTPGGAGGAGGTPGGGTPSSGNNSGPTVNMRKGPDGSWSMANEVAKGFSNATVTARLSDEDREMFRKVIKSIKSSGENTSSGLADIAGRISSAKEASDTKQIEDKNKTGNGGSRTTPLQAANDNEPFTIDLDGDSKAA
jgi:hypothetical protein